MISMDREFNSLFLTISGQTLLQADLFCKNQRLKLLNLSWIGPNKYIAVTPQVFDLWSDPQERYDMVMNTNYQKFEWIREQLQKEGVNIPFPMGN
jgi:hypothetical protein